jgi:hypothetical protein
MIKTSQKRIDLITKWYAELCLEKGAIASQEDIKLAFNEDIKEAAKYILSLR